MTSRKAGFDLPAIVPLRGAQARRTGESNAYRSAQKVRYVHFRIAALREPLLKPSKSSEM